MDPYYQYYQPQTWFYQPEHQYYPPVDQSNFRSEVAHSQFTDSYPAHQGPQGVQIDYIAMRKKIRGIQQFKEETLHEYWKRFKELCSSCPQHQISDQLLVLHFYDGLFPFDLYMVDKASGGPLIDKTPDEAIKLLETMAANPQQFRNGQLVTIRVDEIIPTDVEVPEQRNCIVFDRHDLDFIISQESSNTSCCDVVVVKISDSTDNVVVDVVDDVGTDVDDDVSVGDCTLEAIPQESPELDVDDESVGTCIMEARTQESLSVVVHSPESKPESKLLSDDEEVTTIILEPPGQIFKEHMVGGEVLTSMHNIPLPKWISYLNRLQPPGRTIPIPAWILLLNLLQPPGIKGSLFLPFIFA
ncbi:uncharacterized protein LOC122052363 isoform X2 [Zingiber officinale]|uniref:uncharacterized protein LOC122052363 isoform X2 n=1 Tax=Zingiber officinale TaxID=94328 RepID=UPI001C4AE831|nr:uncharacterized protein LOC122052363 isoform X2 [Zingiber officinale]